MSAQTKGVTYFSCHMKRTVAYPLYLNIVMCGKGGVIIFFEITDTTKQVNHVVACPIKLLNENKITYCKNDHLTNPSILLL